MPTTIQVILRHDLGKLGKSGDLVKVRPGFARNYLLPRGFAVPASTAEMHRIAHEKTVALARAQASGTSTASLDGWSVAATKAVSDARVTGALAPGRLDDLLERVEPLSGLVGVDVIDIAEQRAHG